jgi:hypothetical protein
MRAVSQEASKLASATMIAAINVAAAVMSAARITASLFGSASSILMAGRRDMET